MYLDTVCSNLDFLSVYCSTKSYRDARKKLRILVELFLAKSTYRTLKEFNFTRLHR